MKNAFGYIFLFLVAFFVISPTNTYAYLDPGAGSYLFQILAASFFTFFFIFKNWWKEVKAFIYKLVYRKGEENEQASKKGKDAV